MTIDRESGNIVIECNECGDVLEGVTSDFTAAWNRAKREGWHARKVGEQWQHSCGRCKHG